MGSKAGGVRLYDQHSAYAEKGAPEGSLRWEVEARRGSLESVGISWLEDLDAVTVQRLAEQRWEWSKMGTQVSGPVNAVQVMQRAVEAGEIKQGTADRLLGVMVRQAFGYGGQARRSEYRYRPLMERLGVTAGAVWSNDLSAQAVGRLDFEAGTELLELTA